MTEVSNDGKKTWRPNFSVKLNRKLNYLNPLENKKNV